ncbi:MAG: carotenoid oxygenase family protein, partial [Myxococcota bacterium]
MTALPTDTEEPMLEVYKRASRTVERELQVQLEPVSGRVPEGLRGVLFRNGPGRNELFGVPYGHPFDGDGMITRFEFNDGGVRYRNRFVRTRELTEELRAGKPLYRSFGTNLPGGLSRNLARLRFKNAANTSVIDHGGHLLALWEGGWPHRLDPDSLETLGRFDYDGRLLNRNSWVDRVMAPELPFSAHPKFCSRTGEMVNFGMALGVKNRLMLYRVDPLGRMAPPTSHTLDALSFVHDFVMTERHLVFFLPAVAFNVPRTLAGFSTPVDSLTALDRPTRVLVLSREDFRIVGELNASPGFIFPFANAYERHGEFGVDGLQMPRLPDGDAIRDLLAGRDPE